MNSCLCSEPLLLFLILLVTCKYLLQNNLVFSSIKTKAFWILLWKIKSPYNMIKKFNSYIRIISRSRAIISLKAEGFSFSIKVYIGFKLTYSLNCKSDLGRKQWLKLYLISIFLLLLVDVDKSFALYIENLNKWFRIVLIYCSISLLPIKLINKWLCYIKK